jgi:hypothetical protein
MHFLTLSATAQVNEKVSASTTTGKTKISNAKDVKNAKAVAVCKSKSRFISTELAKDVTLLTKSQSTSTPTPSSKTKISKGKRC